VAVKNYFINGLAAAGLSLKPIAMTEWNIFCSGSTDIVSIVTSFSSGQKGVVPVNKGITEKTTAINFQYFTPGSKFYYYTLKGGTDNGDFSRMVYVNGSGPSSTYTTIGMNSTAAEMELQLLCRQEVWCRLWWITDAPRCQRRDKSKRSEFFLLFYCRVIVAKC
jgi:hypothetical protein